MRLSSLQSPLEKILLLNSKPQAASRQYHAIHQPSVASKFNPIRIDQRRSKLLVIGTAVNYGYGVWQGNGQS
eukprot:scaffold3240_cov75-Skeletonema_dohrnii-CCMP3373.AAC.2